MKKLLFVFAAMCLLSHTAAAQEVEIRINHVDLVSGDTLANGDLDVFHLFGNEMSMGMCLTGNVDISFWMEGLGDGEYLAVWYDSYVVIDSVFGLDTVIIKRGSGTVDTIYEEGTVPVFHNGFNTYRLNREFYDDEPVFGIGVYAFGGRRSAVRLKDIVITGGLGYEM